MRRLGRPEKITAESRPKRSQFIPKEIKCMFSACDFYPHPSNAELHRVYTDPMGETLIRIKMATLIDSVRVCVSDLEKKGDAAALEKYYHRQCLRNAQRSCEAKDEAESDKLTRSICDELLVLSVNSSLFVEDTVLSMRNINDEYLSILEDYGMNNMYSVDHKKHLKDLLKNRIPAIQFVKSLRKNESETVSLEFHVIQAMDFASSHTTSVETMANLAKILREEALNYRHWELETDFNNFKCPPMLQFFLNQLLFGRFCKSVTGKRDFQLQKTLEISCQFILQNLRTDRQVKHTPKKDEGFRCNVDTPLSVGLPLAIHGKSRDKAYINQLNKLGIGKDYQYILNIEKRTEYAVLKRIEETGLFCLPDFVNEGVNTWFAVDNIDLLEDTPYGQNTFHGTVIVLNQTEDKGAKLINSPLSIPHTLPAKPLKSPLIIEMNPRYKRSL